MKLDRNNLAPGTVVRWLNNGWVIAEIIERIKGAEKVLYRTKPCWGMKSFGGASHTTGWEHSLIGADCLIDLGPDSEDTLTPPNIAFAYNQSKDYFEGKLEKLPEYYPQDRNMYAYWREQKDTSKVYVPPEELATGVTAKPPAKPNTAAVETRSTPTRVRERVRPAAAPAPVPEPVVEAEPKPIVTRVRTRTRTP